MFFLKFTDMLAHIIWCNHEDNRLHHSDLCLYVSKNYSFEWRTKTANKLFLFLCLLSFE